MKFFIKCNPPKSTAQASMRIMKRSDGTQFVGKFANSKGKRTQNDLMSLLREHVPETASDCPVSVCIVWAYPWRKSETKKRKARGWQPCDTRPDCDNLCKLLLDCMTRLGFWNDDSQVYDLHFVKKWCDTPGIGIEITEHEETA